MDCSPPGSPVHGISQARILEWVAIFFPGDLPDPGTEPASLMSPALAGRIVTIVTMGFPGSSVGKEFACSAGDPSSIPGQEDALEKR